MNSLELVQIRPRRTLCALCLLGVLFGTESSVDAQIGTASMTASSGAGVAGSVVSHSVVLNSTDPTAACSYGLRADLNSLLFSNIALGQVLLDSNGGSGPTFVSIEQYTTMSGFSFGMILSFVSATIPANVDHTITTFDLTVLPGAPVGVTPIELRSDLADPGDVPVEVLATTATGGEMPTTGVAGAFEVLDGTPTATLEVITQAAPTEAGALATASVFVTGSGEIGGFSFGLGHDSATLALAIGDVVIGPDLAATRGGLGPEYLSIDIFQSGFTFATIVNVTVAGAGLTADVANEVAQIQYSVRPTASFGPTPLTFTETLGTPPVLLSVGMGLVAVEPPTLSNGSLFVATPFMRGDLNQSGFVTVSDVTALLAQLFGGATIACLDAADINGSGVASISDATYFLEFLFNQGPSLPAPFGVCGLPDLPPTLSCSASACP